MYLLMSYNKFSNHRMSPKSAIYHDRAAIYEIFSQAEDGPGKIDTYLR